MKQFRNKRVLVVGLGRFGGHLGLIKWLYQKGSRIRITDLKTESELKDSLKKLKALNNIEYSLGGHRLSDIDWAEVIFINPAVPPASDFYQAILASAKKIETGINLIFQLSRAKIIGVTGTNGKATVSHLIHTFLTFSQPPHQVLIGGNMGISLLDKIEQLTPDDVVILELSSFQLARLAWIKKSPDIAVLTNLTPDHLDWHQSLDNYIQSKLNIFTYQNQDQAAFVNFYDPISQQRLADWPFRSQPHILNTPDNHIVDNQTLKIAGQLIRLDELKLPGRHNLINVSQAAMVAVHLGISRSTIIKALANFRPPEHALETVRIINGVRYVNDSEASNQDAALKALESFPAGRIVLIAGGYDKGIDLSRLADKITTLTKGVVLIGQTADKIIDLLEERSYHNYTKANSLKQAVATAAQQAKPGDVVLLSPAASSYDMFNNLEERGALFKKYVHQLADGIKKR